VQTSRDTLDDPTRLRIATRIHFALRRHFGEDIAVGTLLNRGGEAREALWVCESSGDPELMSLARQYADVLRNPEASNSRH